MSQHSNECQQHRREKTKYSCYKLAIPDELIELVHFPNTFLMEEGGWFFFFFSISLSNVPVTFSRETFLHRWKSLRSSAPTLLSPSCTSSWPLHLAVILHISVRELPFRDSSSDLFLCLPPTRLIFLPHTFLAPWTSVRST